VLESAPASGAAAAAPPAGMITQKSGKMNYLRASCAAYILVIVIRRYVMVRLHIVLTLSLTEHRSFTATAMKF
jgi:hypothetical protein